MTKKKMPSKSVKWIVIGIMTFVTVVAIGIVAVKFYNWSYKRGYLDGTNNQVLCQAAQKDTTLSNLCK